MLYVLDARLNLTGGVEVAAVWAVMAGHILAQAELKAYYVGK